MAKVAARASRVYFDQFDLSGVLSASSLKVDQEVIDVTAFADTGPRRVAGNHTHSGELTGFFDGADNGFDERAFVDLRTDAHHYVTQTFGASAEGSRAYDRVVRLTAQPRKSAVGQAVMLNLTDDGSGPIVRSWILGNATVTGTGQRTGYDMGATTSGQVVAVVFRVLSLAGGPGSITLQVQESSDDGVGDTYALVTGLTATFTATGVSRVTTTAATEAWKRLRISAYSGFTSATVLCTAGVVSNT